ncbi:HIV Tat-specific factor 1 [Balamuthia mandrillaris]
MGDGGGGGGGGGGGAPQHVPSQQGNEEGAAPSASSSNPYFYTDAMGQQWAWDFTQQAWIPFVDNSLFEQQQAAYGAASSTTTTTKEVGSSSQAEEGGNKRKRNDKNQRSRNNRPKKASKPENTSIYITGLPQAYPGEDDYLSPVEFSQFFSKCGIIKKDPETGEQKIKIYKDEYGRPKGDGLVTYFKRASVDLAITILDGTEIKPGFPVKVTEAKFEQRPTDNNANKKPAAAPAPFIKKKKKKKARINQEEALGWEDWETRQHVILKHMFDPKEAEGDLTFYEDLRADIKEEVEKLGKVEVVTVFERNPEGVVAVKFAEAEAAAKCIEVMNGRWFAKRQISAEWYDGLTNYKVKESEEEQQKRIEDFGDWLEQQSSSGEDSESSDNEEQ